MAGIGRIEINGKPYNIALDPDSYKVMEIPTHSDVDQKMERRVIWRDFSLGIMRRREDPSLDATSVSSKTYTYFRQVRNPEGFFWAAGCDTTRQNRVFAQRATSQSNMNVATEHFTHFIDGSLVSLTFSEYKVYTLTPPGTWTLSATLSPTGRISDGIQYGGQIYIAIGPVNGTSTSVGATTLTDTTATWATNEFTGGTLTSGGKTATITSNTGTVLTFSGGWTGGTPAVGTYQITQGLYTWNQLSGGSWTQRTVSASHFTVIREQLWRSLNANIYDTINTDPASQVWSGATVIGDPNTPITGLDVFQDFLMIFKQDGVYSADKNGNVYPIFPGFKTLGTNPRGIGQWQDEYYFAADVGLIWAYSPRGGVRRVGFDWSEPYPMDPNDATPTKMYSIPNVATASQGIPLTNFLIVPFNQFVTQGYDSAVGATTLTDASASWIPNEYAGDFLTSGKSTATITSNTATVLTFSGGWTGGTPALQFYSITDHTANAFFLAYDGTGWHPFRYYANAAAVGVGITGGNLVPSNTTLHFCVVPNGSNTQIQYMTQPLIDPFVAASFDTQVQTIYFPADNGALEDEYKIFERVNVFVDNPESGTVRMYYSVDEEIPNLTFHDMGVPQYQGLRGNQIFSPPFPLPQYVKIMLKMTITPSTSITSPAVRNVILHYKQRSPQRRTWDIAILAEQNLVGASGRLDTRNAKKIIDDLNKARINHQQVQLVDALLNKSNVYVDEVGEVIKILKGEQNPSYVVTVKLVENVDQLKT